MVNFDSPTRETCTVRENRTNTPLQALSLMNEVTYLEAARRLAEAVLRNEANSKPEARVRFAFSRVLGREPKASEIRELATALDKFRAFYETNPNKAREFLAATGKSNPDSSLPKGELAAETAVCSLILNLDEAVTRE